MSTGFPLRVWGSHSGSQSQFRVAKILSVKYANISKKKARHTIRPGHPITTFPVNLFLTHTEWMLLKEAFIKYHFRDFYTPFTSILSLSKLNIENTWERGRDR